MPLLMQKQLLGLITDHLLGQEEPAQPKELQTIQTNPTKAF